MERAGSSNSAVHLELQRLQAQLASREAVVADLRAQLQVAGNKYEGMEAALLAQLSRALQLLEDTKALLAEHRTCAHSCDATCARCGLALPKYS